MSFDWSGYLTLAEYLNQHADDFSDQEAVYRSVVSRAYYAVFCLARNYVKDVDRAEFHGNDHQRLQNHLRNHSDKSRKKLGNQLRNLHQHRIKADYHDKLDEPPVNKASRALAEAGNIQAGLEQVYS
jgi:uncharacterized protein (UPF0332 family)